MKPSHFFTKEEKEGILKAIREAEMNTSGEIRVHIERRCKGDVLDRSAYLFGKLGMHKTEKRNGVLFYLAVDDHTFSILGDAGINALTQDDFWDNTKEKMLAEFSEQRFGGGLELGIRMAGEQLKEHFPYEQDDVNELPDDISFGDNRQRQNYEKIYSKLHTDQLHPGPCRCTGYTSTYAAPRMVNDFSGLFNENSNRQLEAKLQEFYYQTSTQIYIVILDDLGGYDIAGFSFLLGEQWGIGSEGKDNGILILLNPSPDRKHGDVFIASGYGLEAVVPDAYANRIVDYDMVPRFRELDYYGGLDAATSTLMGLTRGEYTMDEYIRRNEQAAGTAPSIIVIFFIIFAFSFFGRARRARQHSIGKNIPFWAALFLVSGAGRSHSGSFGNFSSGSGGFGGGFGGGGGGGFGGGGAGGSW